VSIVLACLESVAPVWVLWLLSGAALVMWSRRSCRVPKPVLVHDAEGGFDYTVNLVATLPLLAFLVCLALETTMILTTKLGTLSAAYAAARSGLVWEIHGSAETQRKAQQAATLVMAPFSSGLLGGNGRAPGPVRQAASAYAATYLHATGGPVGGPYLIAQYLRADRATSVGWESPPESRPYLTSRVQYRYPFRFRIIGSLLAGSVDPDTGDRYWTITTTTRLRRQEALDGPNPLGIPYQSEP
jgi:hypothetical protein